MSDFKLRMLGDNCACVTLTSKSTGTCKGKEFSGDYRFMDIFEKKDGKWQAIFSQVTKVKGKGITGRGCGCREDCVFSRWIVRSVARCQIRRASGALLWHRVTERAIHRL